MSDAVQKFNEALVEDLNRQMNNALEAALSDTVKELKKFAIWRPATWKYLYSAVMELIVLAEAWDDFTGEEKKSLIVNYLNARVNIPVVGESFEAVLIGVLVDAVVAFFNRRFGHDWGMVMKNAGVLKTVMSGVDLAKGPSYSPPVADMLAMGNTASGEEGDGEAPALTFSDSNDGMEQPVAEEDAADPGGDEEQA